MRELSASLRAKHAASNADQVLQEEVNRLREMPVTTILPTSLRTQPRQSAADPLRSFMRNVAAGRTNAVHEALAFIAQLPEQQRGAANARLETATQMYEQDRAGRQEIKNR